MRKLVGDRMREWRRGAGLRQDDVARAAREVGLSWLRDTVAAIERGSRMVRVDEFLMLSLFINGPFAVRLDARDEGVQGFLDEVTRGTTYVERSLYGLGDADRKAARRLGVPLIEVAIFSKDLWGRPLSAERDARVVGRLGEFPSKRSLQAHRGHVTRELSGELGAHLDKVGIVRTRERRM